MNKNLWNLFWFTLLVTLALISCNRSAPSAPNTNTNDLLEPIEDLSVLSLDFQQNVLNNSSSSLSKVGSQLALIYSERHNLQAQSAIDTFLPIHNDHVVIDAIAKGNTKGLLNRLKRIGLKGGSVYGNVVSGHLPITSIADLANLEELNFARPSMAITNVGAVTSQGDVAQKSKLARNQSGFKGKGIKVGVLSDSFDNGGAGSFSDDIASNDLPANVMILKEGPANSTDEGRAMAQIVRDVAPKSPIAFYSAFFGMADFANGIIALKDAGADVIVDDVVYFAEPMFQDGIVTQAVNQVVNQGVPYFSSAINSGRDSYESPFRDSQKTFLGTWKLHDFNPNAGVDVLQDITIAPNGQIIIVLQWDEPFASVKAGNPGSSNDVDVFLFGAGGKLIPSTLAAVSISTNSNIDVDPFEVVSFTNLLPVPVKVGLAIGLRQGTDPNLLKWVGFGGGFQTIQFDTNSGTAYGHTNGGKTASVGAAFYQETPAFGTNPPLLEEFSSKGKVPILFNLNGTRKPQAVIRQTPDFVAPDGGNTTFFGTDVEPDGFPNFFGTSAAAPHAAGVAALMLDKNPNATPTQIYDALFSTALDMKSPGYDHNSGAGLIRANLAIKQIP